MFGNKKKKIHAQVTLLLRDIFHFIEGVMSLKPFDDLTDIRILCNAEFCMIGFCSYYVAGLNKVKVAREIVAKYAHLFTNPDNDMNIDQLSANDVGEIINKHYQKAREISDNMMKTNIPLENITIAHATEFFKLIEISADNEDIQILANGFKNFYEDVYEKYYG